ncbi:hypothetical protein A7K91_20500 [Paenibacillus oryzae]|uniref:Uncharacterized protein n=1 Tax=Paenibacillus oryzae TaxID=1844972 RepID=A0A1A5YER4_9BACL|nr:hypothetical protein A7K91_20500 [Paenibacillus oryzae]
MDNHTTKDSNSLEKQTVFLYLDNTTSGTTWPNFNVSDNYTQMMFFIFFLLFSFCQKGFSDKQNIYRR